MTMQRLERNRLAQGALWLLLQAALTVGATFLMGSAGLMIVCIIAWPVAAWINEKQGWVGYALPIMAGASALMLLDGKLGAPLAEWCFAGLTALLITRMNLPLFKDKPRWFREGIIHGSMGLAALVTVILCLQDSYPGGIAQGISGDLVALIKDAPNGAQLLYNFYAAGLVPLETSMTAVTEGADGILYMSAEVRDQLLLGLRARLDEALELGIPSISVYLVALTTLLAVMLPVTVRRRRGEKDETPRFDRWHLPKDMGRPIACLFLGAALPMLTSVPALVAMGQLMYAVASVVYSVMGASVLRFASKLGGRRPVISWVMILLAAVAIPQMLMVLGVLDQWKDLRRLNKNNETEEDRV